MKNVSILKQDHFGCGLAKVDEKLVFIEGALPNEICDIEIIEDKKKYSVARINNLVKESPNRVIPKCPYYDICGGCHIMHQDRDSQLSFKKDKVKELLERFACLKDIKINDVVRVNDFNYRNKIILHGPNNKLGFYKEQTHDVVEIRKCLITNSEINNIYKRVLDYLENNKNELINKLMIRNTSINEKMISIDGSIDVDKFICFFNDIDSIYINNKLISGKDFITEEIFNLKFKVYPDSFFQINYDIMMILYKKIQDFYKTKNYSNVLDLYCGTGTIGMIISKYVDRVIGVEVVESSIKSAIECMKINNINNITFKCGKVENMIDEFNNIDSVVVDPPRKGLDKHTIDAILKLNPESIIYVSCDPVTLSRDLKILLNKYNLVEVTPFDMFPNTYHVETMVILNRK